MQDPHFITHKAYLNDIDTAARAARSGDQRVAKANRPPKTRTTVMLTVILACFVALPLAL